LKVSIVGASGKLGQYMVQQSIDRGYDVVGVRRDRDTRHARRAARARSHRANYATFLR
jgi:uncharacterized protein YbjT (DUF2867 family)